MKKLLLSIFALTAYVGVNAQCNELFISQYVEGTGNNKALGIYNPTPNPINLNSQYRLTRYNNGTDSTTAFGNTQASTNLGNHVIPAGKEWVLVIDLVDPAGTGQNAPCAVALQQKADTLLDPDYNTGYAMYFNGNDALSIQKSTDGGTTWHYVDIFGKIGDPAMVTALSWSDQDPYDGSVGTFWTKDHTLIRKHTVKQGVTVNPSPNEFIVTTEWDSLPKNTFDSLGIHRCDCPTAGINEIDNSVSVKIFPNPSNDNYFQAVSTEAIEVIEVFNSIGQIEIRKEGNKFNKQMLVETSQLAKGMYFVKMSFSKNRTTVVKLSIQ